MIKYLVMDVDGTLTDGKIHLGNCGEVFKSFNIKDGYAIKHLLPFINAVPVVITGRNSQIVKNRCDELNIESVFQNVTDKISTLLTITQGELESVAYIGDDLNDYACMEKVKSSGGIAGCPADAAKEIKELSDFISSRNGGDGAVREFIEWLIKTLISGE